MILSNQEFFKRIKPFLSDENKIFSQIIIEIDNRIISDGFDLSEKLITFFKDIVRSLNIKPHKSYISESDNMGEPIEVTIKMFKNYPKCSRY